MTCNKHCKNTCCTNSKTTAQNAPAPWLAQCAFKCCKATISPSGIHWICYELTVGCIQKGFGWPWTFSSAWGDTCHSLWNVRCEPFSWNYSLTLQTWKSFANIFPTKCKFHGICVQKSQRQLRYDCCCCFQLVKKSWVVLSSSGAGKRTPEYKYKDN